jgi:hypothetical protein
MLYSKQLSQLKQAFRACTFSTLRLYTSLINRTYGINRVIAPKYGQNYYHSAPGKRVFSERNMLK